MTIFGIVISSHSGIWWVLGAIAAWLIACGFFWCMCAASGKADQIKGVK